MDQAGGTLYADMAGTLSVLGDVTKIKYTPTTAAERFTVLQSGAIDMLAPEHHALIETFRAGGLPEPVTG